MSVCQDCNSERQWLHKHHLTPRSLGGTDCAANIIHICANCHEDRHGGPCGGTSRGRSSATPEARAKKGKTFKRLWQEPEYREKVLAARHANKHKRDNAAIGRKVAAKWTPEKRAAHSEKLKAAHAANPEKWAYNRQVVSQLTAQRWRDHPEKMRSQLKIGHRKHEQPPISQRP